MGSHVRRDELPAFESESSSSVLNNRDTHRWLGATVTAVSTDRGRCFPLCCPSSWAQWLVSLRCYFQHWTELGAINITGSKEERKKVYEWIQTNSQYKAPAKPKLELSASFSNFYSRRNIWRYVCEEELRGPKVVCWVINSADQGQLCLCRSQKVRTFWGRWSCLFSSKITGWQTFTNPAGLLQHNMPANKHCL